MKNLWLHGIYLAVIGVLGFQLWAKTKAFNDFLVQIDRLSEINCEILHGNSQMLLDGIQKIAQTNPPVYGYLITDAKNIRLSSRSINETLIY